MNTLPKKLQFLTRCDNNGCIFQSLESDSTSGGQVGLESLLTPVYIAQFNEPIQIIIIGWNLVMYTGDTRQQFQVYLTL